MSSPKNPHAKGAKTMPLGKRFQKGGPGGPGRPALPEAFKNSAPESLVIIERVAKTGFFDAECEEEAGPAVRWRALERHSDSVYGAPGKARIHSQIPSGDDLIKLLESKVAEAALNGDAEAAVRMLEALDPARWGKRTSEPVDDDLVDLPSWTPLVPGGSS